MGKEQPEVRIGLEIHCQMSNLKTKLFCSCPSDYRDKDPNTVTCPVCLGLPGALPVVNKEAIKMAIKTALVLNSQISRKTYFYRKHYFYPDLPKGYQISQYDRAGAVPFAVGGYLDIEVNGRRKRIRIRRIQIEEDPAKLTYSGASIDVAQFTMIDYNRSGIPLLEIVTEPDLSSAEETVEFLKKLRMLLEHIGVFQGDLEGVMRVDVNLSIGSGARVEIKNLSSLKDVERAISFEILRQTRLMREGIEVRRETLHWDDKARRTYTLREKEEEQDYRYFPDPNLPPLMITDEMIEEVKKELPHLPEMLVEKYVSELGIPENMARVIVQDVTLSRFFDECVESGGNPAEVARWLLKLPKEDKETLLSKWDTSGFAKVVDVLKNYEVPDDIGVNLIHDYLSGKITLEDVEEGGRKIAESRKYLKEKIIEILSSIEVPKKVIERIGGDEEKLRGFVIGQVKKLLSKTYGRFIDSKLVAELVSENFGVVRERVKLEKKEEVTPTVTVRERIVEGLEGLRRTHFTDEVTSDLEGEEVVVYGWVQRISRLGKLTFLVLRDGRGIIQVKISRKECPEEVVKKLKYITPESVVAVKGTVRVDKRAPTGVEIVPSEMRVLAISEKLPYTLEQAREVDLSTRLDYRYIDIRRESVRAIFRIRSTVLHSISNFFHEHGFVEINTPKIIATAAEGGAELFSLLFYGREAYLSQSPQLYKQMATLGFERVFEIGPCYRAEKFHTTKHLVEFWALDVEVAFATYHDLMKILENLMVHVYSDVIEKHPKELEILGVELEVPKPPFPKITYDEALKIAASKGYEVEWGDDVRGEAFRAVSNDFAERGHEFFFIIDFPASARAFYYKPHEKDERLTKSFDLVNSVKGGIELSSGGERINDIDLLVKRLRERGLDPEKYTWYLDMFKYGVPPHGGFGLGIERLLQAMLRLDNIMEAVFVPRTPQRLTP
ncbi:MAG: aspartate--tRNA(Asn) ligase [Candidatus Baldrarchaeia archaeon]